MTDAPFLVIERREAPLILSFPHTGTELPGRFVDRFVSPWLARKNADWHVEKLYAFAADLGATFVRTTVSRSVIDVNRDPSGVSLYPGRTTTGLCPTETFEGEPLYRPGEEPDAAEIAERRAAFYDPFHAALAAEIARLRAIHPRVVVWDCHSIRSVLPRLFEGGLPQFNIGTNSGAACDPAVTAAVAAACRDSGLSTVVDGRFKGGWITRASGRPQTGVHAIQMELAWRGYLPEPTDVTPETWPVAYEPAHAEPVRRVLETALSALLGFARG
jgi:formiminoglutamase